MTTKAAEELYREQHNHSMEGKRWAVYNPNDKSLLDLPIIYGLNTGGPSGFLSAVLISEDGVVLGGHKCSHECYMQHDLGILEGTRPDRHEEFRKHYPDGYRMEFVRYSELKAHEGLNRAIKLLESRDDN